MNPADKNFKKLPAIGLNDLQIRVTHLVAAYYYVYSPVFQFPGESHDCYELVLCNSGEVLVAGDTCESTLSASQAYLHKPGEFHRISANNRMCSVAILLFRSPSPALKSLTDKILFLNTEQKRLMQIIINESCNELNGLNDSTFLRKTPVSPLRGSRQLIKNLLEVLFIRCLRAQERSSKDAGATKKPAVSESALTAGIKKILRQNLSAKLTLDVLSRQTGYSKSYITKHFKKQTGYSIIEYFLLLRIREATKLIFIGKLSYREISEKLGFDSVQYFYRQFKRIVHMTPADYKQSMHIANIAEPFAIL